MAYHPPASPGAAGMACKCPRCAQGDLYDGFLKLAERCPNCGLDYAKADSGDGPAVFLLFIVGFVTVAFMMILQFGIGAPQWLSLLLPILLGGVMIWLTIRPLKAYMIALQYANKAREGRLEDDAATDRRDQEADDFDDAGDRP